MDAISVLENLAKNTHYNPQNDYLFSLLSEEFALLLKTNDNEGIKKLLSGVEPLPNESHVALIER